MSKYGKTAGVYLAALVPSLVWGTKSPHLSLACMINILLASGAASMGAKLFKKNENPMLTQFAAIMLSAAAAFGAELIICEAFPSSFEPAPTAALTGAPLFFAVCTSHLRLKMRYSLCCTAASALLVIFTGALRLLLSLLPLHKDLSVGLILAGVVIAVIKLFIPDREEKSWAA